MNTGELNRLVDSLKDDETKFANGNNSSGSRMRKTLQELKKAVQTMRVEILDEQKARKAAK